MSDQFLTVTTPKGKSLINLHHVFLIVPKDEDDTDFKSRIYHTFAKPYAPTQYEITEVEETIDEIKELSPV